MNINNYSLWTAVITPLLENFEVDFESLTNIINDQEKAQNGLPILGSTGEALNLNLETRKKIIQHVVGMKPKSPIMVGIGGNLLEEQKEWMTFLEGLNIDAYLLVTPHYAKPGAEGQYQWFKALLDHSTRPCMLYNVPGRTAVAMSIEAVRRLKEHKNFWSIKEASGSLERFKEFVSVSEKKVFSGDDALMPDFALAGAAGLVSVASNAWPQETNAYVRECLERTFDAKELWAKASDSLFIASNPVPVKRLMHEKGMIKTNKLILPLSHDDLKSSEVVLEADKNITNWFKGEK